MKASLTFNLPEEREQYECAVRGEDMYIALFNIRQKLFKNRHTAASLDPRFAKFCSKGGRLNRQAEELLQVLEEMCDEIIIEAKAFR